MLLKAAQTLLARITIAAATLGLVVLTSRLLGPEGRGVISLLTLSMALIMLANDFLAGSALVYFTSRKNIRSLIIPSYIWALILSLAAIPILYYTEFIPSEQVLLLVLASFFYCLLSVHYSLMLGRQMITQRNLLQTLLPILQLIIFWIFFDAAKGVAQYVGMLNFSIGICLLISIFIILPFIKNTSKAEQSYYPEHLRYGLISQSGNILIFLAYRFNFKVLDHYQGKEELGVYSTAVMLAEALLMLTQSIATVQQARIVNSSDDAYQVKLVLRNFKLAILLLLGAGLVLAVLPSVFYVFIFGDGFEGIREILLLFLPAVLFLGLSSVLSHYYAAVARFKTMLYANLFCLLMVAGAGFILIPEWGAYGAAISQSLAYAGILIFYLIRFAREKNLSLRDFLPDRSLFSKETVDL